MPGPTAADHQASDPAEQLTSLSSPVRIAWACVERSDARRAALVAALHLAERLTLVIAALVLVEQRGVKLLGVTAILCAVAVGRGFVRSKLLARLQVTFHRHAAEALLRGDLFSVNAVDAEAVVLTGTDGGARLFAIVLPQAASDAVASVVLFIFLTFNAPGSLLFAGGVAVLLATMSMMLLRRATSREHARAWATYEPIVDAIVTASHARLELVANGAAALFQQRLDDRLRTWAQVQSRTDRISAIAGRFPLLTAAIAAAVALFLQGALRGDITIATFREAALFASVLPSFAGLAWGLHEATRATVRFAPLGQLLSAEPLPRSRRGGMTPGTEALTLPRSVAWRNVSYTYSGGTIPAVSHVDLIWKRGELLVVSGPNGCGKSTLLRLLLAVTSRYEGAINIDGQELMTVDMDHWRGAVAYLPQRPFLGDRAAVDQAFSLTSQVEDAARRRALESVDLWRVLVAKAPNAPLSVRVGELSAGERQRLAIARVLAADKPLVLLDEPDANLDAESTRALAVLLVKVAKDKMIAVAAHTPELHEVADTLVRMENGRVVEQRARPPAAKVSALGSNVAAT